MATLTAEAFRGMIGQEIAVSSWVLVDQARIQAFADATGDHQFIHVDPERAKETSFGGTIAHGFLTLSLLALLMKESDMPVVEGKRMGVNYGMDRLRFLSPVRSGCRVRGRFTLLALDEKRPGQWQQTLQAKVEIESEEKPALIADWITQFFL